MRFLYVAALRRPFRCICTFRLGLVKQKLADSHGSAAFVATSRIVVEDSNKCRFDAIPDLECDCVDSIAIRCFGSGDDVVVTLSSTGAPRADFFIFLILPEIRHAAQPKGDTFCPTFP
jgi:hypothetical protein